MRRSLESLSRSRNMDMSKDPEGITNYADKLIVIFNRVGIWGSDSSSRTKIE